MMPPGFENGAHVALERGHWVALGWVRLWDHTGCIVEISASNDASIARVGAYALIPWPLVAP